MKLYDVTCPFCGTVNKGLYLEETEGWMVCERCHSKTQLPEFEEFKSFPTVSGK